MSHKPKKVEPVTSPSDQKSPQIRILPLFTPEQKKLNVIQITIPGLDGQQDQIVDQEFFSGSNLWFTRRAKRALNKMLKRQTLVSKFIQSISK